MLKSPHTSPAQMLSREGVIAQPSPFFDPGAGMWRVHDFRQVQAAFIDTDTFTPENALLAHVPLSPAALRLLTRVGFALPPTLANNGGPTHAPMRATLVKFFSPARVKHASELTERLVQQRIADIQRRTPLVENLDLVPEFAWEIPARIMFEMIGIPHDDTSVGSPAVSYDTFKQWSQDSLELFWGWPEPERQLELAQQAADFYAWLRAQVRGVRVCPDESLFSALAAMTFSGEATRGPLTDREICAVGYFLFIAGQETTCQLLATALHHSLSDSRVWAELVDPATAAAFVSEVLRVDSPVHTWRRRTSREVTIGEITVPAGAEILLDLANCGVDPKIWQAAQQVDTGRSRVPHHQAFGTGIHRCVGAALAEMEAQVTLTALSHAWPDAHLNDPEPEWLNLLSFRAPLSARAGLG